MSTVFANFLISSSIFSL